MLLKYIPLLLLLSSDFVYYICRSGRKCYNIYYSTFLFLGILTNKYYDGNKRSKSSSFLFKLRCHTAGNESEGNHKEPWHKRSSRNNQQQGKEDDSNRILVAGKQNPLVPLYTHRVRKIARFLLIDFLFFAT